MGHVALITGASRGIGRATAERLSQAGHRVIGVAREKLEADFPGRFVELDLSDAQATDAVLSRLAFEETIDMIVNNVGLVRPAALGSIATDDIVPILDMNLRTSIQTIQPLVPTMRKRSWGRIVNISSVTALGAQTRSGYAAAKAAIISLTRSWALELAASGITVNCVAPGATDTRLFRENNPIGSAAEQRLVSAIPIKRIGRPEEIAAAICYFLSEDAGFTTGQTLFVDGGMSIGRLPV